MRAKKREQAKLDKVIAKVVVAKAKKATKEAKPSYIVILRASSSILFIIAT